MIDVVARVEEFYWNLVAVRQAVEVAADAVNLAREQLGRTGRMIDSGDTALGGRIPVNVSGGLIAKGHPIGATGVAMIGWCAWQLQGKVPEELQVPNPNLAATFNIGGPICASVCTVLRPA